MENNRQIKTLNDDEYNIELPFEYKNWLVFKNSIFLSPDISDCNDTINGVCRDDLTLEQCMDECSKDYKCKAGYYIKEHDNDKGLCVPIRTYVHENLSPVFRLRNKDVYPFLKDDEIYSFSDKELYPFPPDKTNTIFFQDLFNLQNVETKKYLKLEVENTKPILEHLIFTDNDRSNLHFLPFQETMFNSQIYMPVEENQDIILNIPATTLVARKDEDTNNFEWVERLSLVSDVNNSIKLKCVNENKNKGGVITYDDEFYILYNDINIVYLDDSNVLKTTNEPINRAKLNHNIVFKAIPNIKVYYCIGENSYVFDLKDAKMNGVLARYDNYKLYRNPQCYGITKSKKNKNKFYNYFYISLIIMSIIVILYLIYRKYNSNKNI